MPQFDNTTLLDQMLELFPCREHQFRLLYNLYADQDPFPEAVFIHGPTSTGKSFITHQLLKCLDLRHAYVNLVACFTPRILFETMLIQLTNSSVKCDNLMDFIEHLKRLDNLDRFVIVLDRAEQLRNSMPSNLLPAFLRLGEISKLNVSVILISQLSFQKYLSKAHIGEPIQIRFPQYNAKELLEILALDFGSAKNLCPDLDIDEEFYRNYQNIFLSVFYQACRDLSELRYLSRKNLPKYCDPIKNGQCRQNDARALWRHFSPILKDSLETLYLRVNSSDATKTNSILSASLELPFYSKYLLIAAYLASYNPAKDDKRMFMKQHGKKRKTLRDVASKSKVSEQLNTQLGPKAFSLDRLLAIFYAILDDKVGFNNNLLVQVSSLVELQLLTAMSDSYNLDGQKYKCTVNMEFISGLANMVGFNIRKYLSDFSHM